MNGNDLPRGCGGGENGRPETLNRSKFPFPICKPIVGPFARSMDQWTEGLVIISYLGEQTGVWRKLFTSYIGKSPFLSSLVVFFVAVFVAAWATKSQ